MEGGEYGVGRTEVRWDTIGTPSKFPNILLILDHCFSETLSTGIPVGKQDSLAP